MIKIFRPTHSSRVSQKFGESKACIQTLVSPRYAKMVAKKRKLRMREVYEEDDTIYVCPKGYSDFYSSMNMKGHNGIDIPTYVGESLYFNVDSDVTWNAKTHVDQAGGAGIDVISDSPILFEGKKTHLKMRFWHMDTLEVYDGMSVACGMYLGRTGNTGASTANHLHWGVKRCKADGTSLDKENGYYGGMDFQYEDTYVLDYLGIKEHLTSTERMRRSVHTFNQCIKKYL